MSPIESWAPEESLVVADPAVSIYSSRSRSAGHTASRRGAPPHSSPNGSTDAGLNDGSSETEPLLAGSPTATRRKPFYRARPLWLVPFAITAALVRGMTLAPRVAVITQLSCSRVHQNYNHTEGTLVGVPQAPYVRLHPLGAEFNTTPIRTGGTSIELHRIDDGDKTGDEARKLCSADPEVSSDAALIQTMFTTTMGLLSALTTIWWGRFSDRHGRTKVLAICTFGLFLTDLTFIFVSIPSSSISSYGRTLLLIAPVIEGLLGGSATLQLGTSAYISDCTSSGSRASIFSRFTGVSLLGFSLGPLLGGWLIQHRIAIVGSTPSQSQSVTTVFIIAACCSFVNLCLVLFVFPESVTREQRDLASGRVRGRGQDRISGVATAGEIDEIVEPPAKKSSILGNFLSPLAIFLPVPIFIDGSTRKRKDWSLTLLAGALFGHYLSMGIFQIKYLYGSHVYNWGPEQLSYYISFLGGSRALFLLLLFPLIISVFKPKSQLPKVKSAQNGAQGGKSKPKPTKTHLAREIKFDVRLTRLSLCLDIAANCCIVLAPAPMYKLHSSQLRLFGGGGGDPAVSEAQFRNSQALFVLSSWIACWGAGAVPALHSLALCIVQARALLEDEAGAVVAVDAAAGTGRLFGALAVLQATGQMILGPLLFGLVYSGTVAMFPKTIFVTSAGILSASLLATVLVRSPLAEVKGKSVSQRGQIRLGEEGQEDVLEAAVLEEEERRGRSRASKDLRGYGSTSEYWSPPEQGPSSSGSN